MDSLYSRNIGTSYLILESNQIHVPLKAIINLYSCYCVCLAVTSKQKFYSSIFLTKPINMDTGGKVTRQNEVSFFINHTL